MAIVNNTALATRLKEKVKDYEKIFALKMAQGFEEAKAFLTTLSIDQKVSLKRSILGNITQPGRTGTINNQTDFMQHKERIAVLKPFKVDLYLSENALYDLRVSFLNSIQSADPDDIYSIAAANYIMDAIMSQIGAEVSNAIYSGVEGYEVEGVNETAFQGGLNLFDGLGFKFLKGYATSGDGYVGDIPAANKVTSPASTVSESNILAELKKIQKIILSNPALAKVALSKKAEDANALILPPTHFMYMVDALDSLTYKNSQLVEKSAEEGVYQFKQMPFCKVKMADFMTGVDNMFWSPKNNLFLLSPMASNDVTSIILEPKDRGIQVLIDGEMNTDYADGRYIVLHK